MRVGRRCILFMTRGRNSAPSLRARPSTDPGVNMVVGSVVDFSLDTELSLCFVLRP
ncbi:hypothetical protein E2C01_072588 [Portunus trituberculatus]|uniref:Uncharacterized protein n=1 Tax=Portunus trituberculatus TaxID=210409 RepID=A0A5B7I098_PORTR|nr:hypothetical protein [Portunus trituberculatus]